MASLLDDPALSVYHAITSSFAPRNSAAIFRFAWLMETDRRGRHRCQRMREQNENKTLSYIFGVL